MIKPPALQPGARIAIISPAGAPKPQMVERGLQCLATLGYQPVLFPSALAQGPIYFAGNIAARVADLHNAFADPTIGAVFCTRGGWGTAELLPHLNADLIRQNPKPFLGFSDPTTLHLWFAQTCGLGTFYGPMISPDFARGDSVDKGVDVRSFRNALTQTEPWSLGPPDGLRLLRPGKHTQTARGTLFGGCLALLNDSLGTPWALTPPAGDSILFLEEVGTHPYQWDRMLLHLRYAGILDRVQAIVLGDMEQCLTTISAEERARESALLLAALLHNLRDFAGPIAIGLGCGHVNTPNITLPLNVETELDLDGEPELRILESAVS
ncbi:S66 peptidase family protein [Terriglobus aquaticus]|uniref:LD-carboxypeptidase n=1 Tax=Terriglobus aquaticus TaxID=940139 RepID=A0ABW9KJ63_9BACT|nr:LD-carboxypeptidase [Terriglobus aquaticus]